MKFLKHRALLVIYLHNLL